MTGPPPARPTRASLWLRLPFILAVTVPLVAMRSQRPGIVQIFVIALVAFGGSQALALALQGWANRRPDQAARARAQTQVVLGMMGAAAIALGVSIGVRALLDGPARASTATVSHDVTAPKSRPPAPNEVVPGQWRAVAVGSNIGAAVGDDGMVYEWNAQPAPYQQGPRVTAAIAGTEGATEVSVSFGHSCAIAGGNAVCWGWNFDGAVGQPSTGSYDRRESAVAPALPEGVRLIHVSAGAGHSCGVDAEGGVWCWGSNNAGQAGQPPGEAKLPPTRMSGLPIAARTVVARFHASCALGADSRVYCWGDLELRGNGFSPEKFSETPRVVGELRDIVAIDMGESSACALDRRGSVWCWGRQIEGSILGQPVLAPIQNAAAIAVGDSHRCALRADGTVACWGQNWYGMLGDGTREPSKEPVAVRGVADAQQIAAGSSESCAILHDGRMICWGRFDHGTY